MAEKLSQKSNKFNKLLQLKKSGITKSPSIQLIPSKSIPTEVMSVINYWNSKSHLKKIVINPKTKIFKITVKFIQNLLKSGFIGLKLNENWLKANNISNTIVKSPLSVAKIKEVIKFSENLLKAQKYKYRIMKTVTLADFICHRIDQTSTLLLVLSNEMVDTIETRLKKLLVIVAKLPIEEVVTYWKLQGNPKRAKELYDTNMEIHNWEQEAQDQLDIMKDAGIRAINLMRGKYDGTAFTDQEIEELHQVIYDMYTKVVHPVINMDSIPKHPHLHCNGYNAVMKYFEYLQEYSRNNYDRDFKISYLKIGGKGFWQTYIDREQRNHREVILRKEQE